MTTLPHDTFGGTRPEGRKVNNVLTFERALAVAGILIGLGTLVAMVKGHDTRLTNIEVREREHEKVMNEMNANIKVLLERTDPKR